MNNRRARGGFLLVATCGRTAVVFKFLFVHEGGGSTGACVRVTVVTVVVMGWWGGARLEPALHTAFGGERRNGKKQPFLGEPVRGRLLAQTCQSLKASWERTPPVRPDQLR